MENNTTSNTQDNVTETTTAGYFNAQYCGFKLPCGYCTRLCQPCPMGGLNVTPQPIWTASGSGLANTNKCEVSC